MVGGVTERLAPDTDFLITNGTNNTAEVDITARDLYRVQVAAATTVLGGLIQVCKQHLAELIMFYSVVTAAKTHPHTSLFAQVVLGLVKFGFVGTYLSEPMVRAYTTAAAAHAVVAQLKHIFGVSPGRSSGAFSLVYVSTFKHLVPTAAFLLKHQH